MVPGHWQVGGSKGGKEGGREGGREGRQKDIPGWSSRTSPCMSEGRS